MASIAYRKGCQWPTRDVVPSAVLSFPEMEQRREHAALFDASIITIKGELHLSEVNLDGSHSAAKKGGEAVAYQGRKKVKTSNILPVTDRNGAIIATTGIIAGNHNDSYELIEKLKNAFKDMNRCGLDVKGAFFNADRSFDTRESRKLLWNRGVIPTIP